MESKLKQLKVVDLKDILAKASVTITGKANKQDLIAKVLASPEAVEVYNKNYGPAPVEAKQAASSIPAAASEKPEAPQPPKVAVPSSTSQATKVVAAPTPPTTSKPVSKAAPHSVGATSACRGHVNLTNAPKTDATVSPAKPSEPTSTEGTVPKSPEDEEAERRRARAERFGIAVVQPKAASPQKNGKAAKSGSLLDDPEKLAARAARFGTQAPSAQTTATTQTNGRKRAAPPPEPVDEEELARRRKRSERFGIPLVST
ncbi:hypothetical protein C8Q76DRAFT_703775 [Earliella scabrosa]|nr:hypothetical protein C8Q76DRAFT_703775 [Earliella scabrosa]